VKRAMLRLDGAEELRHLVLKKWGYRIVSTRINEAFINKDWQNATIARSYATKFSCPTCGADAVESFIELEPDDPEEMEWWRIHWGSTCSHLGPIWGVNEEACAATPVEKNGVIVGSIEPVSPPMWPRYEGNGDTSVPDRPCAFFGTLCQAMYASVDECRLLAAIQAAEDEEGQVKRK
jgi:hypothetical protein